MSQTPQSWMPAARMERVICHWTAGPHRATVLDKKHYHVIVEADGKLVRGNRSIKDNEAPVRGAYAAHTLNCNTGSIGVSMACMAGARESPFDAGSHPMTQKQWDAMVRLCADLCQRYKIAVTPKTVLSHAEVQANLGIRQRGKWDFTRLPFDPSVVGARACGDKLRSEVQAAMGRKRPPAPPAAPEGASGEVTASTLNFRREPDGDKVGELPRGTVVEVIGQSGVWLQVRTPNGHEGWVHGDYVDVDDGAQAEEPTEPDPLRLEADRVRAALDDLVSQLPESSDRLNRALRAFTYSLR